MDEGMNVWTDRKIDDQINMFTTELRESGVSVLYIQKFPWLSYLKINNLTNVGLTYGFI